MNRHVELDLGELIRQVRQDRNICRTPAHQHTCAPARNLREQLSNILATTRLIASGRLSMPQARNMALQIERMAQSGLAGKLDCQDRRSLPPQNGPRSVPDDSEHKPGLEVLSKRELEILAALAHGNTVHEIAALLGRSPKTINNHRTNILHKLKLRNTAELTRMAIRQQLIQP